MNERRSETGKSLDHERHLQTDLRRSEPYVSDYDLPAQPAGRTPPSAGGMTLEQAQQPMRQRPPAPIQADGTLKDPPI